LLLEGLEAVFESSSNSLGVGLRQEEEFAAQRERYQMRAGVVFELVHGCQYTLADMDDSSYLPCMKTDLQLAQFGGGKGWKRPVDLSEMRWHCKRCRNKLRYVTRQQIGAQSFKARMNQRQVTEAMPICNRCGAVHDHQFEQLGGYQAYCQHCDDLNTVEMFYRLRVIFGDSDTEDILDRIQRSHPALFERGVLPDYWYALCLSSIQLHIQ